MEANIRPSLRAKYGSLRQKYSGLGSISESELEKNAKRDQKVLNEMWFMVAFGLTIFLGGFAVWTLDNKYCSKFLHWRRSIGLPWGILLEGHGWW